MILSSLILLTAFARPTPASVGQTRVLWQIGTHDGKAAEFALAPNGYAAYGEDPLFLVGRSGERDWPYVLPGPHDRWAGSRSHGGDIAFGLKGVQGGRAARLVLDLAETHESAPPRISLTVNGKPIAEWQAPEGAGDAVILGQAQTGRASQWTVDIPASALRNGNNVLSLRSKGGSWAVYDALRLESHGDLTSTPLKEELILRLRSARQAILRTPDGPRQPVTCEVVNLGPARSATLRIGTVQRRLELRAGRQEIDLEIPPVKSARMLELVAEAGSLRAGARAKIAPVRPWTVYLFPHSHVDVGYTDLQDRVIQMHERNFRDALAVARGSRNNPPDSRYRFNAESVWVLESYLAKATPAEREELISAIKDGSTLR